MKIREEELELEDLDFYDEFREVGVPLEEDVKEKVDLDVAEIYSDEGVEEMLRNDEIAGFEEGFMRGYLEEAEEGV